MKKQMIIAAIAALAMAVLGTLYEQSDRLHVLPNTRLTLKGTATLMAALLAAYGAWAGGGTPAWIICAGIAVCALADVLLERVFCGHGMLCGGACAVHRGFLMMKRVQPLNIVVFAALMLITLAIMHNLRDKLSPALAYTL